jgi:hypothetical protein
MPSVVIVSLHCIYSCTMEMLLPMLIILLPVANMLPILLFSFYQFLFMAHVASFSLF